MGREISQGYPPPPYSFIQPMSAKFYEHIGYHGGIQATCTFLGNRPSFKFV